VKLASREQTAGSSDSRLTKRDWKRVVGKNSSASRNTTMPRKLDT
jgi:hypothetical protein